MLKLGVRERPQPMFRNNITGCRWEYRCGWCDDVFQTPTALVKHVQRERER